MSGSDTREKLREAFYRKGIEKSKKSTQERLNDVFSILGSTSTKSRLYCLGYEFETLDKIRNRVESGDRKAMLVLLAIVADALHAYEVLPEDVRNALADSLQEMLVNLHQAHNFVPVKRGESSDIKKQEQSNKAYWTALAVESYRFYEKINLEDAIAKVSEEKELTESLVQKRWKNKHKDAKKTLEMISSISKLPKKAVSKNKKNKL